MHYLTLKDTFSLAYIIPNTLRGDEHTNVTKLQILKENIWECLKTYYRNLLNEHFGVFANIAE